MVADTKKASGVVAKETKTSKVALLSYEGDEKRKVALFIRTKGEEGRNSCAQNNNGNTVDTSPQKSLIS